MIRNSRWIPALWLGAALIVGAGARAALAIPQAQQPAYTLAEYNAYTAASKTADPAAKIKALDDFVAKYPMSTLLSFAYRDYYLTYFSQKNYAKTIEYADKELALGDKVDIGTRLEAHIARGQAFTAGQSDKSLVTPEMLAKARDAAAEGLKTLASWQKPAAMTDDQFATQKKNVGVLFNSVAGMAASGLKDFKGAETAYKGAIALNPSDPVTHFNLGVAYLQDMPPQSADGFWELSRSLNLKDQAPVRTYLRSQMLHYQQPSCEKLADDEIKELVTLGASGGDRPASLSIPGADDLQKARDDTANFLPWLQEGGDHGKTMWLATCGLEYPDVAVRVMEIAPGDGDNVTLKVFRAPTQEAMQAATAPNMEVHIMGQAEAKRIQKDDFVRFTGTVTGYQQTPFLLTWDNAKVNMEDIPDEKAAPGAKRPGRGAAPAKKPGA
jgi:tetratricopeptide (TPR) repeat protein